ncbi:MAG: hypothetical protein AAB506_01015 [Patescibacteria group bacterium]
MKKKFLVISGIVFLISIIFLVYLFLSHFRPPNLLRPIVGENYKVRLVQELSSKKIELHTLPDESDDALIASISGILVYFSKNKDLSVQATALQMILGKTTIDNRIPKEIDLRFSKPILRY